MYGSFGKEALKGIKGCTGRRPWLGDKESCTETPRVLQRGASNIYFSVVRSALSIPPWSEGAHKILNKHWAMLKCMPEDALTPTITGMKMAEDTAYTVADLVLAVKQRKGALESGEPVGTEQDLRKQEYEALTQGKAEVSRDQDFVCEPPDHPDPRLNGWFDQVMLAKRLREVRVLETFTRLTPPSPADKDNRPPLSKDQVDWLPAVEILGEGVFLRLSAARLSDWEGRKDVKDRAAKIDNRYKTKFASFHAAPDREITPRLLLIHTLAHILIDGWALESGYPAASLRERLYVSEGMAGLLIYTATSDAAGSLGGVVAQAEGTRLWTAVLEAVAHASWCSSDPLCIEVDAAGVDSLNLAACHACVLLPEVSCEESNLLLDRALIVGTPENPDLGFFAPLVPGR